MKQVLPKSSLDQIFFEGHTYHGWLPDELAESRVRELYDLFKWAPTSANCSPARFVWVRSTEAKAKLAALAAEQNQPKILAAAVTVIIGNDLDFAIKLPKVLPPAYVEPMQKYFSDPVVNETAAFRNATLQGAYLILAARALGLDTGPMSGFDNAAVDKAFFADTKIESNFICCIGYGDPVSVYPRMPRLDFDEVGRFE